MSDASEGGSIHKLCVKLLRNRAALFHVKRDGVRGGCPRVYPQGLHAFYVVFHVKLASLWITSVDNFCRGALPTDGDGCLPAVLVVARGACSSCSQEIDWGQCPVTCTKVSLVPDNAAPLPDFTRWPSFPFEGDMRVKALAPPVAVEPPRSGEDASDCVACNTPDDAYIWVNERWRVRAMDRPTGLPMVLILECRSHLDMGDLPNLLAAELGVMTVRLERAIRSLDGVARVHVNRWGDGSAHLHMWFLARPYGRLQLRGTFLSLWDDILPTIPEEQWRENLALVAAWLAEFGGQTNAEPAHIQWQSPSTFSVSPAAAAGPGTEYGTATTPDADEAGSDVGEATYSTAGDGQGDEVRAVGAARVDEADEVTLPDAEQASADTRSVADSRSDEGLGDSSGGDFPGNATGESATVVSADHVGDTSAESADGGVSAADDRAAAYAGGGGGGFSDDDGVAGQAGDALPADGSKERAGEGSDAIADGDPGEDVTRGGAAAVDSSSGDVVGEGMGAEDQTSDDKANVGAAAGGRSEGDAGLADGTATAGGAGLVGGTGPGDVGPVGGTTKADSAGLAGGAATVRGVGLAGGAATGDDSVDRGRGGDGAATLGERLAASGLADTGSTLTAFSEPGESTPDDDADQAASGDNDPRGTSEAGAASSHSGGDGDREQSSAVRPGLPRQLNRSSEQGRGEAAGAEPSRTSNGAAEDTDGSDEAATANLDRAWAADSDGLARAGVKGVGSDRVTAAGSDGVAKAGSDGASTADSDRVTAAGFDGAEAAGSDGASTAGSDGVATAGSDGVATAGSDGAVTDRTDEDVARPGAAARR